MEPNHIFIIFYKPDAPTEPQKVQLKAIKRLRRSPVFIDIETIVCWAPSEPPKVGLHPRKIAI